jgi:hypothetical protein
LSFNVFDRFNRGIELLIFVQMSPLPISYDHCFDMINPWKNREKKNPNASVIFLLEKIFVRGEFGT